MNSLTQAATLEFGLDRLNQIDWSDDGYFVVVTSEKTVTRVQLLQPDEQAKQNLLKFEQKRKIRNLEG